MHLETFKIYRPPIAPQFVELTEITEEQLTLASHYVTEGVLTSKFYSDAQHIAIATIFKSGQLGELEF